MNWAAAFCLAVAVLGLSACGEVPQPFRHDDDGIPRLARPKMTRGVTVRPPADTPEGRALADALVRALEDQEVPALVHGGPAFGHVIDGEMRDSELRDGGRGTLVRWTLKAPDGTAAAAADHLATPAMLDQNNPVLMKRAAMAAAIQLAQPLADPDALPTLAAPVAAVDTRPTATVAALRGLPGDGDTALTEAIRRALGRGGLLVKPEGGDYLVEGRVTIAPGLPGEETVGIAWIVRRGGTGAELGRIAQDGSVPRGRLSQSWGIMARDIAEGGAAGVVEVVLADTAAGKRKLP